ncbi:MAG: rod shape-determining protein MreC [Bacillota bacterium]
MRDIYQKIVIFVVVFAILFMSLGAGNFLGLNIPNYLRLDRGLYNLISPVVEATAYVYNSVFSYFYVLFNLNSVLDENQELKREVGQLERRVHQLQSSIRQNDRLEEFNGFLDAFKEFTDYELQGAMVIGHGPTNQEEVWIINRGRRHGLEEDMPVISYNGVLVGQIHQTGNSTSQVISITNPRFAVGSIVERSRAVGLVKGDKENSERNIMENIDPEADIEIGDQILTSGFSNNFPRYLPIGRVENVEEDNYGLSKKAQIRLYSAEYTVEEVLIITDF